MIKACAFVRERIDEENRRLALLLKYPDGVFKYKSDPVP